MPTGYTSEIRNGISFEQYALGCARAFGALIMMRDEPLDAPIPDTFEPTTYQDKVLADSRQEMETLLSLDGEQLEAAAACAYEKRVEYYDRAMKEKKELLASYEAMLTKAKAYVPPTPEHTGYAQFMVSQIEESIKWDCDMSYPEVPVLQSATQFKEEKIESLQRTIDFYTKSKSEEIARCETRTAWVKELKKSLTT